MPGAGASSRARFAVEPNGPDVLVGIAGAGGVEQRGSIRRPLGGLEFVDRAGRYLPLAGAVCLDQEDPMFDFTKAMVVPLGDRVGAQLSCSSVVTWRRIEPSVAAMKTWSTPSTVLEYTMYRPSADQLIGLGL